MILRKIKFCKYCGFETCYKVPEGDSIKRAVCVNCHFIDYENPEIITEIIQTNKK